MSAISKLSACAAPLGGNRDSDSRVVAAADLMPALPAVRATTTIRCSLCISRARMKSLPTKPFPPVIAIFKLYALRCHQSLESLVITHVAGADFLLSG